MDKRKGILPLRGCMMTALRSNPTQRYSCFLPVLCKLQSRATACVYCNDQLSHAVENRELIAWIFSMSGFDLLELACLQSMNTVMDDNRMLTLASNERIPLTPSMRLLLEINHMNHCSPATVSRGGVIYVNATDIGWQPVSVNAPKTAGEEGSLGGFFFGLMLMSLTCRQFLFAGRGLLDPKD